MRWLVLALLLATAAPATGQSVILTTKEQQTLKALMGPTGTIEQMLITETAAQPVLSATGTARIMASTGHTLLCSFNGGAYSACLGSGGSGTVTNTGTLTANRFILGNGGVDVTVAPSITGLVLGAGASAPGAYAGTSCTNQFPRSLNASGAATCASVSLTADVTGVLAFANGGTNLSAAADDTTLVSSGSAWVAKALPSCSTASSALAYNIATNTFSCNTISAGGAPTDSTYLLLDASSVGGLTAYRTFAAGTGLSLADGGATSTYTASVNQATAFAWTGAHTWNVQAAITLLPYGVGAGNTGELRLRELAAGGTNYVGLKASDALAATLVWTLPIADGTSGQCLKTDGSAILGWSACSGSGAPTGATYVTLTTDATLTNERVMTAGTGIGLADAGAGSTITVSVAQATNFAWTGTQTHTAQASISLLPFGVATGNTSEVRWLELAASGTNYVGFKAPDAVAVNIMWKLPIADSTGAQCLASDGAQTLSWLSCGTGHSTYAVGDLLSANTTTTLSRVAAVAVGSTFISKGVSTLPAWSQALGLGAAGISATGGVINVVGTGQATSTPSTSGAMGGSIQLIDNSGLGVGAGGGVWFGGFGNTSMFAAIKGGLIDGSNSTTGAIGFVTRRVTTDATLTQALTIWPSSGMTGGSAALTDKGAGTLNMLTGYYTNGVAGLTIAFNVRKGDDSGACSLTFAGGLLVTSTC